MKLKNFMLLAILGVILLLSACRNKADSSTDTVNTIQNEELEIYTEVLTENSTENFLEPTTENITISTTEILTEATSEVITFYANNLTLPKNTNNYNKNIYENNHGRIGAYSYYITSNDNKNSDYEYAIYGINDNNTVKKKIYETKDAQYLFVTDKYIFISPKYTEKGIVRISPNGDFKFLSEGVLHCISDNELYCSYLNPSTNNTEIFKMDINGENRRTIISGKYNFLDKADNTIFLDASSLEPKKGVTLASINVKGKDLKEIAIIPFQYPNESVYEHITYFTICNQAIILNAGCYQGSSAFYFGQTFRFDKAANKVENFIFNNIEKIGIVDDWIYFNENEVDNENTKYWGRKIRLDFSNIQYIGDRFPIILDSSKDGFVYYKKLYYNNNFKYIYNDLYLYNTKRNKDILLFNYKKAPISSHCDYIDYSIDTKTDDFIYFTVNVHGYNNYDIWRGHDCYVAYYRIKTNGSNLQLLSEEYSPDGSCEADNISYVK